MAAAPPSESDPRILCWRCKEPHPPAFFCPHCDAVQLVPSDANYATLFGFAGGPEVDEEELRRRYYDLSRRLHPDRFQTGTIDEQRASLQATALLNTAFKTLKDVESRGRWWLERSGERLSRDNSRVPPELATKVFDIQEKIADLAGTTADERDRRQGELRDVLRDLSGQLEEGRGSLRRLLAGSPPDEAALDLEELKRVLSELSYLRTLARDVRSAIED